MCTTLWWDGGYLYFFLYSFNFREEIRDSKLPGVAYTHSHKSKWRACTSGSNWATNENRELKLIFILLNGNCCILLSYLNWLSNRDKFKAKEIEENDNSNLLKTNEKIKPFWYINTICIHATNYLGWIQPHSKQTTEEQKKYVLMM